MWTWVRWPRPCLPSTVSALLCVERDPEACHRSLVADRLAAVLGLPVRHLLPDSAE